MSAIDLNTFLSYMDHRQASELVFSADAPPSINVDGVARPLGAMQTSEKDVRDLAYSLLSPRQRRDFEATPEANLAVARKGFGSFRVNVYRQRGRVAVAVQHVA